MTDKNDRNKHANLSKAERQYVRSMVHNLSLQRFTDQEIVNYLHEEKKIEIARSTVNGIRNQVEKEAGKWYIDLRESSYKSIAFYKERLDSLLSYQKRLNEILSGTNVPEIGVRAIAELHRIEMSLHTIFHEFPHEQYNIKPANETEPTRCNCRATGTITHSKCTYCKQVWCPLTLNQDWCPNPECSHGIKGCNFRPYDEHFEWIQCTTCEMWFKTPDIMAVHNCFIKVKPKAIDDDVPIPNIVRSESPQEPNDPLGKEQPIEMSEPNEDDKDEEEEDEDDEERPEPLDRPWTPEEARRANRNNSVQYSAP